MGHRRGRTARALAIPGALASRRAARGAGQPQSIGDPNVAARMPIHTIRDPYAGFAAIRVDPVHNEVVVMDEFKFNIYVYDRLAVTPASAPQTTPKRFIGGGKTLSRYNSDGYVDTKTGDIYIVNNDSEPGVFKFPRTAEGNVEPASELVTPYGAFGMTVDEERGEMFFTIQHDGAIQIYRKGATGEDNAIRLIQGNRTRLADPHGIAFDPKTRLLYVANYGTERDEAPDTVQQMPQPAQYGHARQAAAAELARRQRRPRQRRPARSDLRHRQVRPALDHRARRERHRQRRAGPRHRGSEGAAGVADRRVGRFDARRSLRLERRRRLDQRLQRHRKRRRRADPADQGTADDAAQPERRVGRSGERRSVGRELRQPHRDRLQVGRQWQRGTDPRDPQRAAERADHADQQSRT